MAEPIRLTITAEDLASAILQKLQGEVQKLGASVQASAAAMAGLGTATTQLAERTGMGTSTIQAWKQAQDAAAQAARETAQAVGQMNGAVGAQISRTQAATTATKEASSAATVHSASLRESIGGALGFATALTGVQLGLAAVGTVVHATVEQVTGFETALANVATLGNNSTLVQQRLREELLKLPPALGDSTTLARGLYDVLSAGIPASDSIKFLRVSAELAKAGLADLGSTTEALTKTMAAFKIPVDDANQVADVLFKTVDLGQGSLQQFAHAFPQVTQGAAALGLSFVDTAATMATLTQTFRNADTAGTGFISLLVQLIQNSEQFAAAGINIQQVLSEQGIVGALKVLQNLTGGNAEKMKVLINDIQGFNAALALTGPQFKLLLENQAQFANSTGVVAKGVKLQTDTAATAFKAFVAAAGQYANELAPPFLKAFTEIATAGVKGFAVLRRAQKDFQDFLDQGDKAFSDAGQSVVDFGVKLGILNKQFASTNTTTVTSATTLAELNTRFLGITGTAAQFATELVGVTAGQTLLKESLTKSTVVLTDQQKAALQLSVDLQTLNANVKAFKSGDLKIIDVEKATTDLQATIAAIQRLGETGKINFGELLTRAQGMTQGIRETFGTIPPAWQALLDYLNDRARTELPKIGALFEKLGLQTREALQQSAIESGKDLNALVDTIQKKSTQALEITRDASGAILLQNKTNVEGIGQQIGETFTATTANILKEFHKTVDAINQGEFQRIPDDLRASLDRLAPIVRKATGEIVTITQDASGHVVVSLQKIDMAAGNTGMAFAKTGQEAEAMAANMRAATGATNGLENSLNGLSPAAIAAGHSLDAAGEEVNKYGNAVIDAIDSTTKLNDALSKTVFTQAFATSVSGLLAQLAQVNKEFLDVSGRGDQGSPGLRDFTLKALNAEIAIITEKLKALGVVVADLTKNPLDIAKEAALKAGKTSDAGTTGVGTGTGTVGGGGGTPGGGGGFAGGGVVGRPATSGLVQLDPVTGRPFVPGLGSLDPGRGTTSPIHPIPLTQPFTPTGGAPGSGGLSVVQRGDGSIMAVDSVTGRPVKLDPVTGRPFLPGLDERGDGSIMAVDSVTGRPVFFDLVTGRPFVPGLGSLAPGAGTTSPVHPLPLTQPSAPVAPIHTPTFAGKVIQEQTILLYGTPYSLVATTPNGGKIFKVDRGQTVPIGARVYDLMAAYYYIGDIGAVPPESAVNTDFGRLISNADPTTGRPFVPGLGSLAPGAGTTSPIHPIPLTQPFIAPTRSPSLVPRLSVAGAGSGGGSGTSGGVIGRPFIPPVTPPFRPPDTGIVWQGGSDSLAIGGSGTGPLTPGAQIIGTSQGGPHTTIYMTVTLPPTLDRISADAFVRQVAPALNESMARGQGRFV